jgi:hypothetical protein
MRVVSGSVLDGPILHCSRDDIRRSSIQRLAARNRAAKRVVHGGPQSCLLHLVVEDQTAERLNRMWTL